MKKQNVIIRWIILLPATLIISLLIYYIFTYFMSIWWEGHFMEKIITQYVSTAIWGFSIIIIAYKIAPSKKLHVIFISMSLVLLIISVGVILSILTKVIEGIFQNVCLLGGSVFATYGCYLTEKEKNE